MDVSHFLRTLAAKYNYMKVPYIPAAPSGRVPVTRVGNADLIEVYLSAATEEGDVSLVRLLLYVNGPGEKSARILRKCLEGGADLVAVYPGEKETAPAGAELLGSIPDGLLYLVNKA